MDLALRCVCDTASGGPWGRAWVSWGQRIRASPGRSFPQLSLEGGRPSVGRRQPALLPGPSAEPATAVKGSPTWPAEGRRVAVSLDGGCRRSYGSGSCSRRSAYPPCGLPVFPPPSGGVVPIACLAAFWLRARSTPLRLRAWRVSRRRSRQRGLGSSGGDMRALLLVGRSGGRATVLRRRDTHNDGGVDHGP